MSIVNLGLQSVGIMRKEMLAEAEKALGDFAADQIIAFS